LTPLFTPEKERYRAYLPYSQSSAVLVAVPSHAAALATLLPTMLSLSSAPPVPLHVGENELQIRVEAEDKSLRLLDLTILRAPPGNHRAFASQSPLPARLLPAADGSAPIPTWGDIKVILVLVFCFCFRSPCVSY
jgi:hypothetical protein